jgi:hypothetical protein
MSNNELKLSALMGGAFRHGVSFILYLFLPAGRQGPRPEGRGLHAAQALALRAGYSPFKFDFLEIRGNQ